MDQVLEIASAKDALERFAVENDDLLELESRIGRFNIFDALGMARAEIRHSNFLAWLLDPLESHGQGSLFLKAVVTDMLRHCPADRRPLNPIELDGVELRGVEIRREWEHTDLLITCQSPQFVIVLENKVDAGEYADKLQRYEDRAKREFPGVRPLFLFLTPSGWKAPDDDWVTYSYRDIHRVLSRCRRSYADTIGADVRTFLDHYLQLIGSRFMNDPGIDELCRRIYRNHRVAIDLIMSRVESPLAERIAYFESRLKEDATFLVKWRTANLIGFVPVEWGELSWSPESQPGEVIQYLVDFGRRRPRVRLIIQVLPCHDAALRERVVRRICAHRELGLKTKWRKITPTYTRLLTATIGTWGLDEEPDLADLWGKARTRLYALRDDLTALPSIVREELRTVAADRRSDAQ